MQKILTSPSFLIPTLIIANIYILSTTYLMNIRLVQDTLFGSFTIIYKANLMFALLQGMWTAMSKSSLIILFLTGFLTGANLTLLVQRLSILKKAGNLHFVAGGSTLFGVAASGCTACGLPLISFLGLSGSVLYLPLRGLELSYIAIILLSISLYFQLRNYEAACRIKTK